MFQRPKRWTRSFDNHKENHLEKAIVARKNPISSLLQSAIRVIVPKDERFYDMLEEQARIANKAAAMLADLATRDLTVVAEAIQKKEHEGDAVSHTLEEALAATFVTPLDREDLQRLSSLLDDVLDDVNHAARSCKMRGIARPTAPMLKMIELLGRMTVLLEYAVGRLRLHNFAVITSVARDVQALESEGDVVYRHAITALYSDAKIDAKQTLREEKVLEEIEAALNRAEDLADLLVYLSVKHG